MGIKKDAAKAKYDKDRLAADLKFSDSYNAALFNLDHVSMNAATAEHTKVIGAATAEYDKVRTED